MKTKNKIETFFKTNWLLILILALAASLRFYRLPEMASYDFDQEYVTQFVLEIARIYPLKFIGQGLSVIGLFMGPFYFYSLVPFYLLTGLDPIGGFVGSVLFGLIIVFLYYKIAKEIFNSKTVGLIAAFIRAIGFYAVSADWSMVPSYTSDAVVLLVWYILFLIWKNKKTAITNFKSINFWLLPALFFIFGMFTSLHPIQFPLGILFLVLIIIWRKCFSLINLLVAIFAGLLPVLPLIYFDYLRKWSMANQIFEMFTNKGEGSSVELYEFVKILKAALLQWQDIFHTDFHNRPVSILVLILAWSWILFQLKKHTKGNLKFHLTSIITLIIVIIGYYSFFPTHVPEYYLRSLQAISVLYVSFGLGILLKNYKHMGQIAFLTLIVTFSYLNISKLWGLWHQTDLIKFANKQAAIKYIIKQTNGEPFRVSYVTELGKQYGFQSLFEVENAAIGSEGPIYSIVVPATFISTPEELEFTSGGVGVNHPN